MGLSNGREAYSLEDVDLFFLYCLETDDCMLIENKEIYGNMSVRFRYSSDYPRNGQVSNIRFVEDYNPKKTFERMGYVVI